MIRIIERMPAGTIGVEAVGKVTEDDYRDVLVPAISAAVERNDVRLLYVLGTEFDSYAPGAVWGRHEALGGTPRGLEEGGDRVRRRLAGARRQGLRVPGEVRVFETDEVDDAKEWLAGLDDDDDNN